MDDLSAFQRDALYVVSNLGAPKGLAIKSALETYYGENINHGRLYPNLDALVEDGYLEKGQRDKRTNKYTLTDAGRTAIEERLAWEYDNAHDDVSLPRP